MTTDLIFHLPFYAEQTVGLKDPASFVRLVGFRGTYLGKPEFGGGKLILFPLGVLGDLKHGLPKKHSPSLVDMPFDIKQKRAEGFFLGVRVLSLNSFLYFHVVKFQHLAKNFKEGKTVHFKIAAQNLLQYLRKSAYAAVKSNFLFGSLAGLVGKSLRSFDLFFLHIHKLQIPFRENNIFRHRR